MKKHILAAFRRRKKALPPMKPGTDTAAADYDPLDPHGDGTLRPGDPIFDAMMRGKAMVGRRNDDGTWDMKEVGDGTQG